MLFNTFFWLVKVLLTPTIEKIILSSATGLIPFMRLSIYPDSSASHKWCGRIGNCIMNDESKLYIVRAIPVHNNTCVHSIHLSKSMTN